MPAATPLPTLSALLASPIEIGDPDVCDPLAVFPLFGPSPRLDYRSFAEASAQGATVTELPEGASVNDVLVSNPLDVPVLLYEGEELVGAQQNRTVDSAVLVAARSKLSIAVSCVEHGRWDGSRRDEAFSPSRHAAFPALRAAKSRQMRASLAAGLEARADQGEVWDHVGERIDAVAAESPTGAMEDAYEARRGHVERLQARVTRRDGQLGCLVAIAGEWVVLDYVSRADVFAALHGPLVAGYALDATPRLAPAASPSLDDARRFLDELTAAVPRTRPGVGLGSTLAVSAAAAGATGLAAHGELVQLSAYAEDRGRTRIRRPSRRR